MCACNKTQVFLVQVTLGHMSAVLAHIFAILEIQDKDIKLRH